MPDLGKLKALVIGLGWPKASFVICLILLVRHLVTFQECLSLFLVALLFHFLPTDIQHGNTRVRARGKKLS
jgi:hypothetical protein